MCLAHYTQPHPFLGQLPKDGDIMMKRRSKERSKQGYRQGDYAAAGMLFFAEERRWKHICLFVDTFFTGSHWHVHDQKWSPDLAFSSFCVKNLTTQFEFCSGKSVANFTSVRGAIWKESKCSIFSNALQLWGLSSEGQAAALNNSHRFLKRDSCQCLFFPSEKNETFYFEPVSRIYRERVTCHTSKLWVKNLKKLLRKSLVFLHALEVYAQVKENYVRKWDHQSSLCTARSCRLSRTTVDSIFLSARQLSCKISVQLWTNR